MKYLTLVLAVLLTTSSSFALAVKVKVQNSTKDKLCAKSAGIALGNKLDFWGEPAVTPIFVTEIEAAQVYAVRTSTESEDSVVYQIRMSNMRSEDGTCTATHLRTSANAVWENL